MFSTIDEELIIIANFNYCTISHNGKFPGLTKLLILLTDKKISSIWNYVVTQYIRNNKTLVKPVFGNIRNQR